MIISIILYIFIFYFFSHINLILIFCYFFYFSLFSYLLDDELPFRKYLFIYKLQLFPYKCKKHPILQFLIWLLVMFSKFSSKILIDFFGFFLNSNLYPISKIGVFFLQCFLLYLLLFRWNLHIFYIFLSIFHRYFIPISLKFSYFLYKY